MRKAIVAATLALGVVFALSFVAFGHPEGGFGRGYGYGRMGPGFGGGPMHFDPDSLKTVTGKVTRTTTGDAFARFGMAAIEIEAGGKKMLVHIGPAWYLARENFSVKAGDEVKVVGTPVSVGDESYIVAQSVTAGEKTLALRDDAGYPLWRGGGRFSGRFRGRGPGYGRGAGPGWGGPCWGSGGGPGYGRMHYGPMMHWDY